MTGPTSPDPRPLRAAVIDYGAGNLVSVDQALRAVGAEPFLARTPDRLAGADLLVVPGVGAAAPAMLRLRRQRLADPIREWAAAGRPILGICLGFQLLYERSEEDGSRNLAILAGRTIALRGAPTLPHIGWNSTERRKESALLDGVPDASQFYFVHSFAPDPADRSTVLLETEHGGRFVSAVETGAIVGLQFHPERSSLLGLRLLGNVVRAARARLESSGIPPASEVA